MWGIFFFFLLKNKNNNYYYWRLLHHNTCFDLMSLNLVLEVGNNSHFLPSTPYYITENFEKSIQGDVIYSDFSKVFDTANHNVIIRLMEILQFSRKLRASNRYSIGLKPRPFALCSVHQWYSWWNRLCRLRRCREKFKQT